MGDAFDTSQAEHFINSEGPRRNWRFSCTLLHNRTTPLYNLVMIKPLVYRDCSGFHSLTTTTHPPNANLPSSWQPATAWLSARKVCVAGGGETGPKTPWLGTLQLVPGVTCLSQNFLFFWALAYVLWKVHYT